MPAVKQGRQEGTLPYGEPKTPVETKYKGDGVGLGDRESHRRVRDGLLIQVAGILEFQELPLRQPPALVLGELQLLPPGIGAGIEEMLGSLAGGVGLGTEPEVDPADVVEADKDFHESPGHFR